MNKINKQLFFSNFFYMISAALLLVIGTMVQEKSIVRGLLITEWVLIFVPVCIYIKVFRRTKEDIHLKPIGFKDGILSFLITVLLYPTIIFVNMTFLLFMDIFIDFEMAQAIIPKDLREYLLYIPVVVISAGICEELFFRGIIMSEYRILGKKNQIILSAVLFGVFHFNFQNLVGPVILGLVFGYLVYRTGSIFAGIIGHMTNNLIALTLGFVSQTYISQQVVETNVELREIIGGVLLLGIIAFICIQIITILMNKISRYSNDEPTDMEGLFLSETGFAPWIPVLIVVAAYWIINTLIILL
ncbi:MAG: CPBP family intramembrane metalloprotease [Clostridiales bacterium]|nr:CPBP family intramembrane metalloprotease [Clostridiales bacterium]